MRGDAACFKQIHLIKVLGPPVFPDLVGLGGCLLPHRLQCLSLCNLWLDFVSKFCTGRKTVCLCLMLSNAVIAGSAVDYHPSDWKEAGDKTAAVRKGMLGSGINSLSVCLVELRVQPQGIFQGAVYAQGQVWQQRYMQHSYWPQWELLAESEGGMALEVCDTEHGLGKRVPVFCCGCFFNERAAALVVFWALILLCTFNRPMHTVG